MFRPLLLWGPENQRFRKGVGGRGSAINKPPKNSQKRSLEISKFLFLPVLTARLLETRAGQGQGEDRARNGRGPGEERARMGKCKGVRGRGRKTLVFGGSESVNRAK